MSVAETQPDASDVPHVPTGPTKVATGDLHPRHVDFDQIASTPNGQSVWRIIYGTELSGGLAGQTEDIEFQIIEPDGTGTINSAGTFTGCLDGLEGGFVFESEGVQNADGSFVMDFVIVPGTGHGELAALAGRYTVVATREHCGPGDTTCQTLVSYTLTYRLPAVPNLKNVAAILPVADHAAAVAWYKQWIGREPDLQPMEGVADWQLADNAWIYVTRDPENAGKTSVIIGVEDIDSHVASLASVGVACGEIQDYDFLKMTEVVDPEGNKINFVWENPNYEPPTE